MNKETITLEFNENQQQFHHNDGSHELNTQGWVTIMENCTDEIGVNFTEYVEKLNGDKKLTLAFVKQCVATFTKKSSLHIRKDYRHALRRCLQKICRYRKVFSFIRLLTH